MKPETDIVALSRLMAGDFSNQQQAFENPPMFAHIRVCMRPLPADFFDQGLGLFLEQAYDFMLSQPYRVRVLQFLPQADQILLINCSVSNQEDFYGAARNRDLLSTLTRDRVEAMPGCEMNVAWTGQSYRGKIVPGRACRVFRNNQETYLENEFEVFDQKLYSLDRGRDLTTDERIWGSIAGPFEFEKTASFAQEVQG
ncbi:chromophore lyase CpcT/CpeT [Lyngbya confervoides]|uniref:Chromophore lyase CpcT/CpeT n=1 Tax=Lyngbya confervoides BDU141951 TaxID=1574623 RepID=A0ABD4T362_9CYAN|nr:chromophore lyase CpcT/CpeT [Lyngbya confervoides]MCM1982987.1 chromophore lyase CpcT/CpeT [Lyngbya confervoides BDU141951]